MLVTPSGLWAPGSMEGASRILTPAGAQLRARSSRVDPSTPRQQSNRSAWRVATGLWRNALTGAQRDDWNTFALNSPFDSRLRGTVTLLGIHAFRTLNVRLLTAGLAPRFPAPTAFGYPPAPSATVSLTAAGNISVDYDLADEWRTSDVGVLLVNALSPRNLSSNQIGRLAIHLGTLAGSSTSPPSPPLVLPYPWGGNSAWSASVGIAQVGNNGAPSPDAKQPAPPTQVQPCPTICSACPTTHTVTVAGRTDCAALNRAWQVTIQGTSCNWTSAPFNSGCFPQLVNMRMDCTGNTWKITMFRGVGPIIMAEWTAPNATNCPKIGPWTLLSGTGTATVTTP